MSSIRRFWDFVQDIDSLPSPGHGSLRRLVDLDACLRSHPGEVFLAEEYLLTPFCFDLQRYGELYEHALCVKVDPDVDWVGYVLQCMGKHTLEEVDPAFVELHRRCFLPVMSGEGLRGADVSQYIDYVLGSPDFRARFESFGMPWVADRVLFELD